MIDPDGSHSLAGMKRHRSFDGSVDIPKNWDSHICLFFL